MLNYKSVLCAAPFNSIFLKHGTSQTCCAINLKENNLQDIQVDQDIKTVFDSTNTELRNHFLKIELDETKFHSNCVNCNSRQDLLQREHHNIVAQESNLDLDNPKISYLHIDFNNVCNLACRICSSINSNQLVTESKLLNPDARPNSDVKISANTVLYKSILNNLRDIRYLRFSGGEPLLNEDVWTLIETAYKLGYTKNIDFKVNTNGTIKLSKQRLEILKSFKGTHIDISMDGIYEHAEYIRTNVVWDKWLANLLEYQREFKNSSNIDFSIVATMSVYNIHIFDQIKTFFNNLDIAVNTNMLFDPEKLCSYNINRSAKDYLNELYKDKYPELLHFINFDNKINPREIVEYIDQKDNIVLSNKLYKNYKPFREVDPKWYAILKG